MKFEVKDGCFGYAAGEQVLDSICFSVKEPEIVSILGANGAGKTTLLKCMLGLLPWRSGASYLDGTDIRALRSREFWKKVGYVPQARLSSFVYTIEEMVVLGRSSRLREWERPGKKDWEKVEEALETVGIAHLAKKLCNEVSGGEYQMAMIARALVSDPGLLVLDEPESNLDFKNQRLVLDTVARLCREKGIAAILNTHYPDHALDISQKALLLLPEGNALFGQTREILQEENLQRAFGIPVRIRQVELPEGEVTCVFPVAQKPGEPQT